MPYFQVTARIGSKPKTFEEIVAVTDPKNIPNAVLHKTRSQNEPCIIENAIEIDAAQIPISQLSVLEFFELTGRKLQTNALAAYDVHYDTEYAKKLSQPIVLKGTTTHSAGSIVKHTQKKNQIESYDMRGFGLSGTKITVTDFQPIELSQMRMDEISIAEYELLESCVITEDQIKINEITQQINDGYQTAAEILKKEFGYTHDADLINTHSEILRDIALLRVDCLEPGLNVIYDSIYNYDYGNNFPEPFEHEKEIPYHAWVRFNDLCFDLDAPEGVDHWSKLPFYQREIQTLYALRNEK